MRLVYANKYRSYVHFGNFGDDLNEYLWSRLLPGYFDNENDNVSFLGFGTILNHHLSSLSGYLIVLGSGYGYGNPPSIGENWKIYCVRGPITARKLGLDERLGLGDPAILISRLRQSKVKKHRVSLMPHAFDMAQGEQTWRKIASGLNYHLIDARGPIESVLEDIAGSELLLSAAMHGAIVADALRVPWVPLKTNAGIPEHKWKDHFQALGVDVKLKRVFRGSRLTDRLPSFEAIEVAFVQSQLYLIRENSQPKISKHKTLEERLTQIEEKIYDFKRDFPL